MVTRVTIGLSPTLVAATTTPAAATNTEVTLTRVTLTKKLSVAATTTRLALTGQLTRVSRPKGSKNGAPGPNKQRGQNNVDVLMARLIANW